MHRNATQRNAGPAESAMSTGTGNQTGRIFRTDASGGGRARLRSGAAEGRVCFTLAHPQPKLTQGDATQIGSRAASIHSN